MRASDLPRQLVLPFDARPGLTRGDFISAPCNEAALALVDRWPDWPARAVGIHGPESSGKSHLVEVWRAASGGQSIALRGLTRDHVQSLGGHVAVEDVDRDAAHSEETGRALLALFERPSGTLLVTGRGEPKEWPAAIGDLESRFAALLALPILAPDDTLLGNMARKLFADRQLEVPDSVIRRMLRTLERTPGSVAAFVTELDLKALAERRPVSERLVLDFLAEREPR